MPSSTASIGMNLAGVNYYSTEYPFIDRFKTSGSWTAQSAYADIKTTIPLNANGYPTGIPAGASRLYTMVELDPVSLPTTDTYVLTYSGNVKISIGSGKIISADPGKVVFQFTGSTNMAQIIVDSIDSSKQLNDMHIVRQDQVALFNQGNIFNPDFLAKISNWSELRFMDWGNTNNSTLTSWSQRTTLQSASWAANTTSSSVPIEVMVALANETHTTMWLNIPAEADDGYVRQTMTYVRDHLDPSLQVKVEYSNEMWNWQFSQSTYALTMGDQLFGKDANGDGKIDSKDPAEHVGDGYMQYYGYRSAQVAAIAQSVFAGSANTQVVDVLSTQTAYKGLEASIFKGIAKANVGSVSTLFHDYAVTTYFGLPGSTEAQMVAWARAGSGGVDAAFASLTEALDDNKSLYAYQQSIAAKFGLTLVAYEGGVSTTTTQYSAAAQPEILAFLKTLDSDPRMAALYQKMSSDFAASGGQSLDAFNDATTPGKYGTWGTLDSIYDPTSPRYQALVAAAAAGKAAAAVANPAGSAASRYVTTSNTNATLDALALTLSYTGSAAFSGTGNALDNTLTGGSGANVLMGGAGNDTLFGGAANDVLDGGTGADRMVGGGGNDIYMVDNVGDAVAESVGGGTDEVRTTLTSYTLGDNVENLTYTGSVAFSGTGNNANNIITGGSGANTLLGGDGNDTLNGGAGTNYLDGGTGADKMIGGADNDIYVVDNVGDSVTELFNGGIDEVRTTLNRYDLGANVENLTFKASGNFTGVGNALQNVITGGAGNDVFYAGAGDDTLYGGGGDDILSGDAGADAMYGGTGNDTYYVDNVGDNVIENPNEGNDTVNSSISYNLTANVETLQLQGSAFINGSGNDLNNWISGNSGSNILQGGGGNDTIFGREGDDTIFGGLGDDVLYGDDGNDTIDGGLGNDTLYGGAGNDRLIGSVGNDVMAGQAGADTFVFGPGTLGANRATTTLISDFTRSQGDRIDFSAIDAISGTAANDAFRFIGTVAFTKHAGELRIQSVGGFWDVLGDLNGDGIADFSLTVSNTSGPLIANDFIL